MYYKYLIMHKTWSHVSTHAVSDCWFNLCYLSNDINPSLNPPWLWLWTQNIINLSDQDTPTTTTTISIKFLVNICNEYRLVEIFDLLNLQCMLDNFLQYKYLIIKLFWHSQQGLVEMDSYQTQVQINTQQSTILFVCLFSLILCLCLPPHYNTHTYRVS